MIVSRAHMLYCQARHRCCNTRVLSDTSGSKQTADARASQGPAVDMSALTVAEGDGGAVDSPSGMALFAMAARDGAHNNAMFTSEHAALADASKTCVMPHTESCTHSKRCRRD